MKDKHPLSVGINQAHVTSIQRRTTAMVVAWQGLAVVLVSFSLVRTETADYGYGTDPGNHLEVSGTHLLSGTVTSTGAAAAEPLPIPIT